MLLAVDTVTEGAAIAGGVSIVVLLVRELAPKLFVYLSGRDTLMAKEKTRVRKRIEDRLDECERDRERLFAECAELRTELALLREDMVEWKEFAVTADVTCDAGGKIISWNRGAEILFHYTGDEAIGLGIANIVPARDRKRCTDKFSEAVERQGLSEGDVVSLRDSFGVRKDGSEIPVTIDIYVVAVEPLQFGTTIRKRTP